MAAKWLGEEQDLRKTDTGVIQLRRMGCNGSSGRRIGNSSDRPLRNIVPKMDEWVDKIWHFS